MWNNVPGTCCHISSSVIQGVQFTIRRSQHNASLRWIGGFTILIWPRMWIKWMFWINNGSACCLAAPSHYLNQFDLSQIRSRDIQLRANSQGKLRPSTTKISLKMTYQRFHWNFPWVNEFTFHAADGCTPCKCFLEMTINISVWFTSLVISKWWNRQSNTKMYCVGLVVW